MFLLNGAGVLVIAQARKFEVSKMIKLQATVSAKKPRVEFVRAPTYRRGLFDGAPPENS
jgi:hypothetical protein